jgi:hypothetical protein
MKLKPRRLILWLLLLLFTSGAMYGFLGVILGAWLSATPHFPQERAQRDVEIWATVMLVCFAMAFINAVLLYRSSKN